MVTRRGSIKTWEEENMLLLSHRTNLNTVVIRICNPGAEPGLQPQVFQRLRHRNGEFKMIPDNSGRA